MSKTEIKVIATGPYAVNGEFTLVDSAGNEFGLGGRSKITLCGCGQSKNAPFCDGSHNRCDVAGDRSARDLPSRG